MIAQIQGALSKSVGAVSASGSSIRALSGAHPVITGVILGVAAYYAINKFWLNKDDSETEETAEAD
jgi:hypothetical protein